MDNYKELFIESLRERAQYHHRQYSYLMEKLHEYSPAPPDHNWGFDAVGELSLLPTAKINVGERMEEFISEVNLRGIYGEELIIKPECPDNWSRTYAIAIYDFVEDEYETIDPTHFVKEFFKDSRLTVRCNTNTNEIEVYYE